MKVICAHCGAKLDLARIEGHCTRCSSVFDVYYRRDEALNAADAYNDGGVEPNPKAAVRRLVDGRGWVVFYRDQSRLLEVAERVLRGPTR